MVQKLRQLISVIVIVNVERRNLFEPLARDAFRLSTDKGSLLGRQLDRFAGRGLYGDVQFAVTRRLSFRSLYAINSNSIQRRTLSLAD